MRFRFIKLFAALLLLLFTIGVTSATGRHPAAQFAVSGAFLILLVIGALASSGSGGVRRMTLGLAALTLILRILYELLGSPAIETMTYAVALVILSSVAALTIQHLLKSKRVTGDTLAASLCAYGFLVASWAAAYSLLEILQPGSFVYPDMIDSQRQMRFGLGESATALYFSFVTITTLGYGDVLPATDAARLLSAGEAFVGQAYIAIVVAKLVGQYIVAGQAEADHK